MWEKPECEYCRTNVNVVELRTCFRCAFCGRIVKEITGQLKLTKWK